MEYQTVYMAIHPRLSKLITSLCTTVENGEGILDKETTSHDDLFDAFRMSLPFMSNQKGDYSLAQRGSHGLQPKA